MVFAIVHSGSSFVQTWLTFNPKYYICKESDDKARIENNHDGEQVDHLFAKHIWHTLHLKFLPLVLQTTDQSAYEDCQNYRYHQKKYIQ